MRQNDKQMYLLPITLLVLTIMAPSKVLAQSSSSSSAIGPIKKQPDSSTQNLCTLKQDYFTLGDFFANSSEKSVLTFGYSSSSKCDSKQSHVSIISKSNEILMTLKPFDYKEYFYKQNQVQSDNTQPINNKKDSSKSQTSQKDAQQLKKSYYHQTFFSYLNAIEYNKVFKWTVESNKKSLATHETKLRQVSYFDESKFLIADLLNSDQSQLRTMLQGRTLSNYDALIQLSDFDKPLSLQNTGDYEMNLNRNIYPKVPLLVTPGQNSNFDNGKLFNYRFRMPNEEGQKGWNKVLNNYYSINYGNLHLVFVNFDYVLMLDPRQEREADVFKWLQKDLERARNDKDVEWIVLTSYRPLFCSDMELIDCKANFLVLKKYIDLVYKFKVDLVISGKQSYYERTQIPSQLIFHEQYQHVEKDVNNNNSKKMKQAGKVVLNQKQPVFISAGCKSAPLDSQINKNKDNNQQKNEKAGQKYSFIDKFTEKRHYGRCFAEITVKQFLLTYKLISFVSLDKKTEQKPKNPSQNPSQKTKNPTQPQQSKTSDSLPNTQDKTTEKDKNRINGVIEKYAFTLEDQIKLVKEEHYTDGGSLIVMFCSIALILLAIVLKYYKVLFFKHTSQHLKAVKDLRKEEFDNQFNYQGLQEIQEMQEIQQKEQERQIQGEQMEQGYIRNSNKFKRSDSLQQKEKVSKGIINVNRQSCEFEGLQQLEDGGQE